MIRKLILPSLILLSSICNAQSYPYGIYPTPPLNILDCPVNTEKHYFDRINNVFKLNPIRTNDIVFLGNSITENGKDWGARFSSTIVKNRGISGDQTEGVIRRLGEIFQYKPSKVFLLIGVNDLFRHRTSEATSQYIMNIVDTISKYTPKTKIYVQTILPTRNATLRPRIKQVNDSLKSKAVSATKFTLIDLHPLFADNEDMMKSEYTIDGTHLNEAGYAVWVNELKSLIPPTGEVFPQRPILGQDKKH